MAATFPQRLQQWTYERRVREVQMHTGFQISLFLLRVFSFSLYIIFMYSLGFAKIGWMYSGTVLLKMVLLATLTILPLFR